MDPNNYIGERVRLCEDGKYRWTHPLDLKKNPTILILVYKLFGIFFSIPLLYLVVRAAIEGDWAWAWDNSIKIWLIVMAVFAVIVYLSYRIVVGLYGGKYIVHFTMDSGQLTYRQDAVQEERSRKFGLLVFLVGLVSEEPSTMGQGMYLASGSVHTAPLDKIRRIRPCRSQQLIKLSQGLFQNRVYVQDEDFDRILDFLRQHCPNAK
ncbi:MAG: hypothetical protein K6E61_01115 [Bacteroidales bacterium]|jgi:hypothetical protein|nr:hypothetical protein [Bacteroidales bacterium]